MGFVWNRDLYMGYGVWVYAHWGLGNWVIAFLRHGGNHSLGFRYYYHIEENGGHSPLQKKTELASI